MSFGGKIDRAGLSDAWRAQPPVMRGVLLMCASTVAVSAMQVAIRHVSAEIPPFEIAFFRNIFGLVFLVPFLMRSGFAQMRTKRLGLHALRGLVNVVAMLLFFTALSIIPLAKATALSFTAPIFAAVLSVLVLGERFRLHRWSAIVAGFVGVMIVLRPGMAAVHPGELMAVGSAALWAVTMIIIKVLSRTESTVAIVAWMGIFLGAFSFVPALLVWKTPSYEALAWLAFIGMAGSAAQMTLSQALRETEPTAVLPFDFLKLIWISLLAAWFFDEIPDVYTWIGACVIFASGVYIANRERRRSRGAHRTPPPPPRID